MNENEKEQAPGRIAAVFDDMASADAAVGELEQEHFPREKIAMAFPESAGPPVSRKPDRPDPGPRAVATVGAPGAGHPGWTMGMAPWAFPGVGPVVVLSSMSRARRPDGPDDHRGFLMSLGLHEDVFGELETAFQRGSILVSVETSGKDPIAKNILERNGGHSLDRREK